MVRTFFLVYGVMMPVAPVCFCILKSLILFISVQSPRALLQEVIHGIDESPVNPNLVVHMRTGAAARTAEQGDLFAALDVIPFMLDELFEVAVAGDHAEAMVDRYHISQESVFTGKGDHTIRRGDDWRTHLGCNIETTMKLPSAGNG
jgi:hypothetical protein